MRERARERERGGGCDKTKKEQLFSHLSKTVLEVYINCMYKYG